MVYGGVPKGLSAKPTLSVNTQSDRAISAELTLTYLSAGFDWQANYLVQMQDEKILPNGKNKLPKHKASLFAWLTLANGGKQSFANANTMAIAGEPRATARPTGSALTLKCWPMQRTHQVPFFLPDEEYNDSSFEKRDAPVALRMTALSTPPPPPPPAPPVAAIKAEQEDLGDLKLYRIPERVNVNAKGQKQVAMITQPDVLFERIYFASAASNSRNAAPMGIMLRGKNDDEGGLGLPMPSGQVQIFEGSNFGPLLVGESKMKDLAVGQKVEITIGSSSDVRIEQVLVSENKRKRVWKITLSNAHNNDVDAEVKLSRGAKGKSRNIRKVDGIPTWRGIIPANDEISFGYEQKLDR